MSDYGEISGAYDTLRVHPEPGTDEQQRAAILAILWRVENGLETPADALVVLQALGLQDTPQESRCKPLSTRQRLQAQRRAAREEEAS